MDSNAQRPSSSSTSSSSNQRSSAGSCGGISSNNSWCSLESVPPPTPFDEKSPLSVQDPLKSHASQLDIDDDDDDEYTDFFTNPCVIDDPPLLEESSPQKYNKEDSESSTILFRPPPIPPTLIFSSSHNAHDDEEQSRSPRHDGTNSSTHTHISASTDSGGASEEEARLSSAPLCSSVQPEHTLSDISGPCSSSILREETGTRDGAESSGVATASASLPVVLGSTTTSTSSSLSDTDEDTEGHRVLGMTRASKIHEYDVLPPPPEAADIEEIVPMAVDTCEDYWTRLHDVRINGCILEYIGVGKSLHDNGFAQSNVPLTPLSHYFEITIQDPGKNCFISIGLARKDYNIRKNPGWCSGSIAYHTDDGKIFIGGGSGTPFGPRCTVHDILGCGIIFPSKYAELPEGSTWPWEVEKAPESSKARVPPKPTRHRRKARSYGGTDNFGRLSSDEDDESEDDIWWNNIDQVCEDKVKVFFMRNRKLLGIKEVRIPKGGFYPTIGIGIGMSTNERVSVDLHPLSG